MDPVYARAIGVDVDELLISQPDNGEQPLEVMGKSGENPLLSRSCEVSTFIDISQNARLISQFDEDRPMTFPFLKLSLIHI